MTRTLNTLIDQHVAERALSGEITGGTAANVTNLLGHLGKAHGERQLRSFGPATIRRYQLATGHLAPGTRKLYRAHVRAFCRWLAQNPDVPEITKDHSHLLSPVRQPRLAPVTLTMPEVRELLRAVGDDRRARAVLHLMVGLGARCVEVSRLRVEDYDPRSKTIRLRGKGGHERVMPVPASTVRALNAYLDEVGRVAGPLIRSKVESNRGLTPKTLGIYVRRWMRAAGVKTSALDGRSAHGLRRTAGSDVMDRTGNVVVVQAMLGHADIQTTARYYLRSTPLDQLREAMEGRDYEAGGDAAA